MATRLAGALYGISASDETPNKKNLDYYVRQAQKPPGYSVKAVLSAIKGELLPWDQSVGMIHEVAVVFAGETWVVTIRNGYWWHLAGPPDHEAEARRLKRKIEAAATIINKTLRRIAKSKIESEEFFLFNGYARTRFYYDHFKDLT